MNIKQLIKFAESLGWINEKDSQYYPKKISLRNGDKLIRCDGYFGKDYWCYDGNNRRYCFCDDLENLLLMES